MFMVPGTIIFMDLSGSIDKHIVARILICSRSQRDMFADTMIKSVAIKH